MQLAKQAPAGRRRTFFTALLAIATVTTITTLGGPGSTANAGFSAAMPAHTPGPAQPLENGPAVKPPPLYTTPPSDRVENDPHWRSPNVRANTDSTTFAQQEPSIALNPLNHLNVVAAAKDERSAPGPG